MFYRHLYNYDDTPDAKDKYGQTVATSLMATNRRSYQYLGSWCDGVIKTYETWKAKIEAEEEAGDYETFVISSETFLNENPSYTWCFKDGFKVSNNKSKAYSTGKDGTVKFSKADFTMTLPEGKRVEKVTFAGYDNYDADSYLKSLNGVTFTETQYVFPAKVNGEAQNVTHTIKLSTPATGTLTFTIANNQTCLIITLYCSDATGIDEAEVKAGNPITRKYLKQGKIYIDRNGNTYDVLGVKQ